MKFEEQFPSIADLVVISKSSIRASLLKVEIGLKLFQEHCLDKQKVLDAIDKIINVLETGTSKELNQKLKKELELRK